LDAHTVSTRKDFNFYIMSGAGAFWTQVGIRPGTPWFLSWVVFFESNKGEYISQ
jgi:hypothetical protein